MRWRKNPPESPPVALPRLSVVPPLAGVRLPAHSGHRAVCAKCESRAVTSEHLTAGRICAHAHGDGVRREWGVERIHRACKNCGYAWDEACAADVCED